MVEIENFETCSDELHLIANLFSAMKVTLSQKILHSNLSKKLVDWLL